MGVLYSYSLTAFLTEYLMTASVLRLLAECAGVRAIPLGVAVSYAGLQRGNICSGLLMSLS